MLLQFICSLLVTILSLTAYFMLRYERKHGYPTAPTGPESSTTRKDES
jgi:hypothetical protein